eukprot:m.397491 g.397491  ORF g.397491 m.397491 type:complete len:509 (+) comp20107_c1_seq2:1142-2668(+)
MAWLGRSQQLVLDPARSQSFFNELELDREDESDLELLLEAEQRGLLDEITSELLAEARRRGFVPEANASQSLRFEVRFIGSHDISCNDGGQPSSEEIADAVYQVETSPLRDPASERCILELGPGGAKVLMPQIPDNWSPRTVQKTLRKTLRPGKLKAPENFKMEVVLCHMLADISSLERLDKTLNIVMAHNDDGDVFYTVFVYKFREKKKAMDASSYLRQAFMTVLNRRLKTGGDATTFQVSLNRGPNGYGITFIGPQTDEEPAQGIFITRVNKDSPAGQLHGLHPGLEIVEVNGASVQFSTVPKVRRMIKEATGADGGVSLTLRENAHGFAECERQLGRNRPDVQFQGQTTNTLNSELDQLQNMLVANAADKQYTPPVYLEHGSAVFKHFASSSAPTVNDNLYLGENAAAQQAGTLPQSAMTVHNPILLASETDAAETLSHGGYIPLSSLPGQPDKNQLDYLVVADTTASSTATKQLQATAQANAPSYLNALQETNLSTRTRESVFM